MSKYQLLPPLSDSELAALRDDIQANGVRVPIDVDEAGEVLDGHHRKAIALMLGIECPERVVKGLQEFEKVDYALTVNLARRHLDRAERRILVIKSLKRDPRLSDREHARRCGVDHKTVGSIRSDLLTTGEIPQSDRRLGGDGRERPAHNDPTTSTPADVPEEDRQGGSPGDEGGMPVPSESDGGGTPSDAQPQVDDVSNVVDSDETEVQGEAPRQPSAPVDLPQEQPTTGVSVAAPAGDQERSGGSEERGQAAASVPAPPSADKARRSEALTKWALDTPEGRALAKRALVIEWMSDTWEFLDEVGPDVFVEVADAGMHEDMDRLLAAVTGWAAAKKANSGIRLVKGA